MSHAAASLLRDLYRAGLTVSVREDRLRLQGPVERIDETLRDELVQAKPEIISVLRWGDWLLEAPLSVFEKAHCLIEVAVPGLQETLWFVSGAEQVDLLAREGVRRGRIWTTAELRDLMAAPGMTPEDALSVARVKLAFNADVVDVRAADPEVLGSVQQEQAPFDPDPVQGSLELDGAPSEEHDR